MSACVFVGVCQQLTSSYLLSFWLNSVSSYAGLYFNLCICLQFLPPVLWRCWLGGMKGIWPVKTEWSGTGVVICLERGADLHTAQLMPMPLTVSRLVLPFWYRLTRVVLDKGLLNACVYICLHLSKWQSVHLSHTHTHTHPFNGPLSGTTRVSRYQKGKASLDFTEARDSEWQWHHLGHMQVCTSLQTDNHASTPPLSFLQAGCPSCHPTNSVKALMGLDWLFIQIYLWTEPRINFGFRHRLKSETKDWV